MHECIGKTVDTDGDGTVTHVAVASLDDWIVVLVNDLAQVERNDLGDLVELLEVVLVAADEGRERKRRQVADSGLIRRRVLDDLSAKVRRLNGTKVLLVRFA